MEPEQPLRTMRNNGIKLVPEIIASVLITTLIAGGGVYTYQKSQQTKSESDLQTQISNLKQQAQADITIVPSPTATPDQTSSTSAAVTFDAGSFSFTFSDEYTVVEERPQTSTAGRAVLARVAIKEKGKEGVLALTPIRITLSPQGSPAEAPTLDEAFNSWEADGSSGLNVPTNINNFTTSKGTDLRRYEVGVFGGKAYRAVGVDKLSHYRIEYGPAFEELPVNDVQLKQVYEQILDSFEIK